MSLSPRTVLLISSSSDFSIGSTEISGFEFIDSSCYRDGLRHAASARGNAGSFCAMLLTSYRPISSLVPVRFEVEAERCG